MKQLATSPLCCRYYGMATFPPAKLHLGPNRYHEPEMLIYTKRGGYTSGKESTGGREMEK